MVLNLDVEYEGGTEEEGMREEREGGDGGGRVHYIL